MAGRQGHCSGKAEVLREVHSCCLNSSYDLSLFPIDKTAVMMA